MENQNNFEYKYLIGGIEGGSTHSTCIIVNERGNLLIEEPVIGPPINPWLYPNEELWANQVENILKEALKQFIFQNKKKNSEKLPILDALGISTSGSEQAEHVIRLSQLLESKLGPNQKDKSLVLTQKLVINHDTDGAIFTGSNKGGIVLIAGTGSAAQLFYPPVPMNECKSCDNIIDAIRTEKQLLSMCDKFRIGGWGYALGDEGSAYHIAWSSIKYVYDSEDGLLLTSPQSADLDTSYVKERIYTYFKMNHMDDILPYFYQQFDKPFIAKFCMEIVEGAQKGDSLCIKLLETAGFDLGRHLVALLSKADLSKFNGSIQVVCVGAVFKSWKFLRNGFFDCLRLRFNIKSCDTSQNISSLEKSVKLLENSSKNLKPSENPLETLNFTKNHPLETLNFLENTSSMDKSVKLLENSLKTLNLEPKNRTETLNFTKNHPSETLNFPESSLQTLNLTQNISDTIINSNNLENSLQVNNLCLNQQNTENFQHLKQKTTLNSLETSKTTLDSDKNCEKVYDIQNFQEKLEKNSLEITNSENFGKPSENPLEIPNFQNLEKTSENCSENSLEQQNPKNFQNLKSSEFNNSLNKNTENLQDLNQKSIEISSETSKTTENSDKNCEKVSNLENFGKLLENSLEKQNPKNSEKTSENCLENSLEKQNPKNFEQKPLENCLENSLEIQNFQNLKSSEFKICLGHLKQTAAFGASYIAAFTLLKGLKIPLEYENMLDTLEEFYCFPM